MNPLYYELMSQAEGMPDGVAKLEVLEEAIRILDSDGEIEEGYRLRDHYIHMAQLEGFPLKALIAFAWQLGQYDRNPGLYSSNQLLWAYKWIVYNSSHFPDISLQQIYDLLEDLWKRYKEHGYSERTYHYLRFCLAVDMGMLSEAEQYMQRYLKLPRDDYSDCKACEQDMLVLYYAATGQHKQALKSAKLITNGLLKCSQVPHTTFSYLLLPELYDKSEKKARDLHLRGYSLIKGKSDFIYHIGKHIEFCAIIDPEKGIELFEQHIAMAMSNEDPFKKMNFFLYAAMLLQKLEREGSSYRPRVPASLLSNSEEATLANVSRQVTERARSLIQQFDRRNGNHYYTDLSESLWISRARR
ncbi:hypothetical protein [Paenibacillus marinisediminis]